MSVQGNLALIAFFRKSIDTLSLVDIIKISTNTSRYSSSPVFLALRPSLLVREMAIFVGIKTHHTYTLVSLTIRTCSSFIDAVSSPVFTVGIFVDGQPKPRHRSISNASFEKRQEVVDGPCQMARLPFGGEFFGYRKDFSREHHRHLL